MKSGNFRSESGQLAIVSIMIIVALLMGVVLVVFSNQVQGWFGVANQKRQKAHSIAEAGLSYAMLTLAASTTTWTNALNANFTGLEFFDTNPATSQGGLHLYDPGGTGNYYTITCSTGGPLATYQLQIFVTAYTRLQGNMTPTRALTAVVSQKTMSATLPNGLTAAAAVELFSAPTGTLNVDWGPIMILDPTNTWTVAGPMDAGQYPRKFAQAGITGTTPNLRSGSNPQVNSDNLEYWAYSSLGYPAGIDLGSYQTAAQNTTLTATPAPTAKNTAGNVIPNCPNPVVPNCACFSVLNGDIAVFGNSGNYILNQPGTILYVKGDVELDQITMDLKGGVSVFHSSGALIVDGNVTFGNTNGGQVLTLRIPPTASLEYPYVSAHPGTYPCSSSTGSCGSTGTPPSFRGFMYATKNLTNAVTATNLVGALRVDGLLSAQQQLSVAYDDEIGHSILVDHVELQVDSQQETVAH